MIELNYKNRIFACELEEYDYPHGLGISAVFIENSHPIGKVKFLCDRADQRYEVVSAYDYDYLVSRLSEALKTNKYETTLDDMLLWQSETEKTGHNFLSPILAQLGNAF